MNFKMLDMKYEMIGLDRFIEQNTKYYYLLSLLMMCTPGQKGFEFIWLILLNRKLYLDDYIILNKKHDW